MKIQFMYCMMWCKNRTTSFTFLLQITLVEHESQLKTNTILVFNIQGDTPIWEGWYELDSKSPDGNHWYIAFDVYDEDLLAYDALQGELHYFSLE